MKGRNQLLKDCSLTSTHAPRHTRVHTRVHTHTIKCEFKKKIKEASGICRDPELIKWTMAT